MLKHIAMLVMAICLIGCQPDVIEKKIGNESSIEEPTPDTDKKEEEEPQTPPAVSDSINDWKDGSHSSTDLIEK